MKALRILLITLLAVLLIGVIGMIVWATASAQDATEPALEILNQNGVEREDGLLVFRRIHRRTQA